MAPLKSKNPAQKLWRQARNVMSALGAFKTYSKVEPPNGHPDGDHLPAEQQLPKSKKSRKACLALSACLLLAVIAVVAVVVGVKVSQKEKTDPSGNASANSVASVCVNTLYPTVCNNTLAGTDTSKPQRYMQVAIGAAIAATNESRFLVADLQTSSPDKNNTQYSTLAMCTQVLGDCLDQLNTSLYHVSGLRLQSVKSDVGDIQQFLSAALTYQDTCLTGIQEFGVWNGSNALNGTQATHTNQLLSNALSLVNTLAKLTDLSKLIPFHTRRLLSTSKDMDTNGSTPYEMEEDSHIGGRFPHWLPHEGRLLLQTKPSANAVVALDGSGQYKSIQAAVNAAPTSGARWVIYIKAGTYSEYVNVPKGKTNLMMYGDGPGLTIITGSKSVIGSKVSTFFTATLAVVANGFIGRDMTIRNTAGIIGQQAVALRAGADQMAFANLALEGYQDTVYTHVLRQFYSGCTILGTIDYIFGNSAAVFQNCKLLARPGNPSQQNTYTASGRSDPGQNTGLSFLSCTVDAASGLSPTYPTYLGRPWKPYARTVFITSTLGSCVNSAGWLLWNNDPNSGNSVYYGEYANTGAGSGTGRRVSWSKQISITDANKFSVGSFISGQQWLPATSIPYTR